MIVKVEHENRKVLLDYVKKEPSINLFIIGDLEQFGLDVNFMDVYLQYNEHNDITACVLRYYSHVIIYSDRNQFNIEEIMRLIQSFDYKMISGKKSVIDKIVPFLKLDYMKEECYFCKLNNNKQLIEPTRDIHQATVEDLDKIIPLIKMVGFYRDTFKETTTRKLENRAGRLYFMEQNGLVISSAATSIETSVSAMIGGVSTHVNYRKKGLASEIVSKLCLDLLNENKTPCLFFHNPDAGKIYHRLGFIDIDMWTMVSV